MNTTYKRDGDDVHLRYLDQNFLLKSGPEHRDKTLPANTRQRLRHTRYEVRYNHQAIGFVEKVPTEFNNDHWRYCFPDGTEGGVRGRVHDAVWELFDVIVRRPFREAERKAKFANVPFVPPMTIDGITFAFTPTDITDVSDGSIEFEYAVSFPCELGSQYPRGPLPPNWRSSSETVTNYDGHPSAWTTSHYRSGQRYNFAHLTSLEIVVKWLYMHQTYVTVRQMRELHLFDHSIQRLIEAGHGLCSAPMYTELCGFAPSNDLSWKVYVQTQSVFDRGEYVAPREHYRLACQGDWQTAVRQFDVMGDDERSRGCILLLDPQNRLAECCYPSSQADRTRHNWHSIFGEGEEYWRPTAWERVTNDVRNEEIRRKMDRFYSKLKVDDSDRKPN